MVTPHPARAPLSKGAFNSETITTSDLALVSIDLGKHTFHSGRELFRKKLSLQQMMRFFPNLSACTVVMEACARAHFVARELTAMGHQAKLISPQFVKPFVKGNKNDFVDAEAICEAASRPSMRFVSPKTRPSRRFLFCTVCVNRWWVSAPRQSTRCMVFHWSSASPFRRGWQ